MELNRQIQSLNPKAYLISLCLCAQKVLAENTGEEAVVEEVDEERSRRSGRRAGNDPKRQTMPSSKGHVPKHISKGHVPKHYVS